MRRRALSLDPKNPRTLADLGTHLLRTGDEPAARTALEASFKIDPYNKITFNLLGMMDVLERQHLDPAQKFADNRRKRKKIGIELSSCKTDTI